MISQRLATEVPWLHLEFFLFPLYIVPLACKFKALKENYCFLTILSHLLALISLLTTFYTMGSNRNVFLFLIKVGHKIELNHFLSLCHLYDVSSKVLLLSWFLFLHLTQLSKPFYSVLSIFYGSQHIVLNLSNHIPTKYFVFVLGYMYFLMYFHIFEEKYELMKDFPV